MLKIFTKDGFVNITYIVFKISITTLQNYIKKIHTIEHE